MYKKYHIILAAALAVTIGVSSCSKYLDVNKNPNGPEAVASYLYMPSIQGSMATGVQFDSRAMGQYVQNWH